MKEIYITTTVFEYSSGAELPGTERGLIHAAFKSAKNAYAPYSGFKVGASVLLDNGEIITGSNQENAAYPSGNCAERVAIFYANSQFPEMAVLMIALVAINQSGEVIDYPVYPCGACRQVIFETEIRHGKKIKLIFSGKNKIHMVESIKELLPLNFDKDQLFPFG